MVKSRERALKLKFEAEAQQAKKETRSLKEEVQSIKKVSSEKIRGGALELLELQAKAGVIPLTKLRQELVQTLRESIKAKQNRAEFVNDQEILRGIVRLKQLKNEIKDTKQEVAGLSERFKNVGQALRQAFLPLGAVSAGLGLFLTKATGSAQEFNQRMRDVSTITDLGSGALRELGDEILRLSDRLQIPAVELAAGKYQILSAGITDSAKALRVLEQSGKLAKAGLSSVAEAADIMTSAINAFGVDEARAADALFKTVQDGKTTISGLSQSFGSVAATAQKAGLTLTGQSASEAQTAIRSVLVALIKQEKHAIDAAKKLGIEFNTAALRAKGFAGFIEDLKQKTGGSEEALGELFGRIQGLNGILGLSGERQADYIRILRDLEEASGSVEEGFRKQLNAVQGLNIAMQNLSTTVGRALLDVLSPAITAASNAITSLTNTLRDNKPLTAFASGAGLAVVAITGLAAAISGLLFVLAPLGIALATLGVSIGALAAPIAAVVIGAGALAVAFEAVHRRNEFLQKTVADTVREIDDQTKAITDQIPEAQRLAREYDTLAKKAKLTEAEKQRMREIIETLKVQFPELKGKIEEVTNGYISLEAAALAAAKAMAMATRAEAIQKELKAIDKEVRKIQGAIVFGGAPDLGRTIPGEREDKRVAALNSLTGREKELLDELKSNEEKINKLVDEVLNPKTTGGAGDDTGFDKFAKDGDKAAKKITDAQEKLHRLIERMEVDLTGFQKGQFEKRRADALRHYHEQTEEIKKLGKAAKASAEDIGEAEEKALQVYRSVLEQINRDEEKFLRQRSQIVEAMRRELALVNAELSQADPFDDIAAKTGAQPG
jgi:TP901 family phage tail tape measure protein